MRTPSASSPLTLSLSKGEAVERLKSTIFNIAQSQVRSSSIEGKPSRARSTLRQAQGERLNRASTDGRCQRTLGFVSAKALCALLLLGVVSACRSEHSTGHQCFREVAGRGEAIAQVGHVVITDDQITSRLRGQQIFRKAETISKEQLREFVEDQIRFELLVQAAEDRGLSQDPDVVDAARRVMVRKLLDRDMGTQALQNAIADDRIKAYYDKHATMFQAPETRQIVHLQLPPTDQGERAAVRLIHDLQATPTALGQQARTLSLDPKSRAQDGVLPFMDQSELAEQYGAQFANAVFQLPLMQMSKVPLRSAVGFHVVVVASRRPAVERPLAEVRPEIEEKLLRGERIRLFQRYVHELKERHSVALYEDRWEKLAKRLILAEPGKDK